MSRTKIALLLVITGYLTSFFIGLGSWLIVVGIILFWLTKNEFTEMHRKCVLFGSLLFMSVLIVSTLLILYSPEAEILARFIISFGTVLALAVLVFALENQFGKNLIWFVVWASFLFHLSVIFDYQITAVVCDIITNISLVSAYLFAYKNIKP